MRIVGLMSGTPYGAIPLVTGATRGAVLGSWTPAGPAYASTSVDPPPRLRIRA